MSFLKTAALKYFDKDGDGMLNEIERAEMARVEALNTLPFDEFIALPENERTPAEWIHAARALDASKEAVERFARSRARRHQVVAKY